MESQLVVDGGGVSAPRRPTDGNDVVGDKNLLRLPRRQLERERRLHRSPGVELPHRSPRMLHRRPRRPCLLQLHRREVAVPSHVLDDDGEVVGVRPGIHSEGYVETRVVARYSANIIVDAKLIRNCLY